MNLIDIKTKFLLNDTDIEVFINSLNGSPSPYIKQKIIKAWKLFIDSNYNQAASLSQVVLDFVWEELNTGNWKDVEMIWRYLYSIASLIKSLCLYEFKNFELSMQACDMGLLMGPPIFDNVLSKIATLISEDYEENKKADKGETCLKKTEETDLTNPIQENIQEPCNKKLKLDLQYPTINLNHQIPTVDCPSLMHFQQHYLNKEIPVIIKNALANWPAFHGDTKWTIEYIKNLAKNRTVPVEIGRQYTSEDWTQTLMTIGNFIDKYIVAGNNMGYLAQHQLFEQIPELRNDILIPDYCCLTKITDNDIANDENPEKETLIHAWFGPKGTISPLHHDPRDNLLAQVIGKKYIRLYDRKSTKYLYPHESCMLDNTSQVNVEDIDCERFPEFSKAPYFECILNEGDMLYIPEKWWHYVRSLSVSFSVSFWW